MKVLYIGNYRDGTGWANAAIGYIMALDAAGVNVVPRCIRFNEGNAPIPERITELEQGRSNDCDVVIQHVLPHFLDYDGRFAKNIALYVTETSHCRNCAWPERINLMDEAWVPNHAMLYNAEDSYIFKPIQVIPHAFDMEVYQKQYQPLEIPELKDKFVFYYIGEISRRKNIGAMIKAFHLEFDSEEPVALVIKGSMPGKSNVDVDEYLKNLCNGIKDGLKLYPERSLYHSEIFLSQYLTNEQIMRVHATGDCFVSSSFGEAWCIPAFDAMAMGKTPICTNEGGPQDYLMEGGGWLVDASKEPCFGATDTFDELYVGNEEWHSIDLKSLRTAMREAFSDRAKREKHANIGINNAYYYSYAAVGNIMQDALLNRVEPFVYNKKMLQSHDVRKIWT